MGLPPFRARRWQQTPAQDYRGDTRTISNPRDCGTCVRACTHRSQRGKPQPTKPDNARAHRSLHRAGTPPVYQHSNWRNAGSFRSNLVTLCQVVQIRPRQVGASSLGEPTGTPIRSSRSAGRHRRMATFLVALAKKPEGTCAENGALHLQRDEACVQVRRQVGLSQREPDGRKARRAPSWLYQAIKTACAIDGVWIFRFAGPTRPRREASGGFCWLAWAPHQRGVRAAVAGLGPRRGRRLLSTRLRSGTGYTIENRSLAHKPTAAGGCVGVATAVALHHALQPTGPLDLCFPPIKGSASAFARAVAQDPHQTGSAGGWSPWYRLAQLPAHGQCMEQGSGSRARRGQDSVASREHRDDVGRVRRPRDGCQAANSATTRGIRQASSEGRGFTTRSGMAARHPSNHSVTLSDPYLTRALFADFLQVQEKNGSSGRTRTYNPPVNSRMLCH